MVSEVVVGRAALSKATNVKVEGTMNVTVNGEVGWSVGWKWILAVGRSKARSTRLSMEKPARSRAAQWQWYRFE